MRTIKFRLWDAKNQTMIGGDDLAFEEYAPISHLLTSQGIMQFTGLQDKNGKEIYEGDIVRFPDAYMNCSEDGDWDEIVSTGQIKWDDDLAQFYVTKRESIDNDDFWEQIDECKVIGNIYENPELHKEESV